MCGTKNNQPHLFLIFQHNQIIAVIKSVAITAPPATTAMSQMGRLVFLPTSCDSFFPSSMTEGSDVVLGSMVTMAISVRVTGSLVV